MTKQTSIDAYYSIINELSNRQQQVYDCLKAYKILTNKEISNILGLPINQVTPRTNELVKAGLVAEGSPVLQDNGRRAIQWVVK